MSAPDPATEGSNWYHNPAARRILPHLRKVFGTESTKECCFAVVDYDQGWKRLSAKCQSVSFGQEPMLDDFLLQGDNNCAHRLVIVQDVCVEAVRDLIRIFDISPEMFESHLSGGQTLKQETPDSEDLGPTSWITHRLKRDFVSITWPRPFTLVLATDELKIANRIISISKKPQYQSQCNTWRMHVNFQRLYANWSFWDNVSSALEYTAPLVGEERATLWHGHRDGVNYIVLLVDAGLGGNWERVETPATPEETSQLDATGQAVAAQPAAAEANHASSDSRHKSQRQDSLEGSPFQDSRLDRTDRRASAQEGVLNNPATGLEDTSDQHDTKVSSKSNIGDCSGHAAPDHMKDTQADSPLDKTSVSRAVTDCLIVSRRRTFNVIHNLAIRAPCNHLTVREAFEADLIRTVTSTLEDLSKWLELDSISEVELHKVLGPTVIIQEIISQDISDSLRLIHGYLNGIVDLANDELMIEKNIQVWRETLHYLRRKLHNMHDDLTNMTKYLYGHDHKESSPQSAATPQGPLHSLFKTISSTEERLHTTYTILENSISVAEARRGITEAESVARLTELAFVYVPLSFAASFFGMQVKELNPETTSISGFFGLAVGVTLLSYCVRLMVRSNIMKTPSKWIKTRVRYEFNLQEDEPIKTRHVAGFAYRQLWRWTMLGPSWPSMVVVLILGPLIPLITVWANQNLDGDLKVALTIISVITDVLIAYYVLAFVLKKDIRLRYPRYGRQRVRSSPQSISQTS